MAATADTTAIPIIDVAPLFTTDADPAVVRQCIDDITHACRDIGFLCIKNHNINTEMLAETVRRAREFFALPVEQKLALSPVAYNAANSNSYRGYFPATVNGKEGLDLGSPTMSAADIEAMGNPPFHEVTRWPESLGGWKEAMSAYYDAVLELGRALLRALAIGLGLPDNTFESSLAPGRHTMSTLRLNYYPTQAPDAQPVTTDGSVALSCETHVDSALLTILWQGDVGGLQVMAAPVAGQEAERWLDVPAFSDTLVINTGLALQRWTNERLIATNHRVLFTRVERLSIPFFVEPHFDAVLAPIEQLHNDKSLRDPPFEPQTYSTFLANAIKRFKEYQRTDQDDKTNK